MKSTLSLFAAQQKFLQSLFDHKLYLSTIPDRITSPAWKVSDFTFSSSINNNMPKQGCWKGNTIMTTHLFTNRGHAWLNLDRIQVRASVCIKVNKVNFRLFAYRTIPVFAYQTCIKAWVWFSIVLFEKALNGSERSRLELWSNIHQLIFARCT